MDAPFFVNGDVGDVVIPKGAGRIETGGREPIVLRLVCESVLGVPVC